MKKNINPVIIITDSESDVVNIEKKEAKKINATVLRCNCHSEEEVIDKASNADAVLVDLAPITKRVIKNLNNCKIIVRYGIGLNNIDIDAATEAGIYVANVPKFCIDEVSTHTVAMTLALIRKLFLLDKDVKSGKWDFQLQLPMLNLKNSIIGVIGFGNIARLYIKKTKPFGVKHLVYDPYISEEKIKKYGLEPSPLERIIAISDVISIHCPLTKETRHLFTEKELKKMKSSAYLINTARGGIIDEVSLYKALKNKWIAGAALDSMELEPPEKNNPLFELDNIILTPHTAFYSENALYNLHSEAIKEAIRVLSGKLPKNLVNINVLEKEESKKL